MKNIHPKYNKIAFYDINVKKYIYTRSCIDINNKKTIFYKNNKYYIINIDISFYSHKFFNTK
ncbi:50S ribosomal protein L31 [Candidatus Vidania fulgoroideorum]